jgi:hypothetical protein
MPILFRGAGRIASTMGALGVAMVSVEESDLSRA